MIISATPETVLAPLSQRKYPSQLHVSRKNIQRVFEHKILRIIVFFPLHPDMSSFPASFAETDLRVESGHAAIFEFPALSSVPAPAVTWQADDNKLLYGTKYAVTSDNRLVILSVDSADEKKYR